MITLRRFPIFYVLFISNLVSAMLTVINRIRPILDTEKCPDIPNTNIPIGDRRIVVIDNIK